MYIIIYVYVLAEALQSHESGVNVVADVATTLTTIATTKQATGERQKRHTPAFPSLAHG